MIFLVAGVCLLALAGAVYYVRDFGGTWPAAGAGAFLLVALFMLGAMCWSHSARVELRLVAHKYFFAGCYGCLLAAGLMWALPFLVPSYWFFLRTTVAEPVAVALGLLAMSGLPVAVMRLKLPRVALLPLAWIGLILVQLLLGRVVYPQEGLLAALYLLWATGLVVMSAMLRREFGLDRVVITFAWFALAGTLASALIGWGQHIGVDPLPAYLVHDPSPDRVWGNLGQPNQLAVYLTFGLASAGYLYSIGRLHLLLAAPITLALVYVLELTGSRGVWLYLLGLTVLSAVFWALGRSVNSRRLLGLSAGALGIFALLPFLLGSMLEQSPLPGSLGARLSPDVLAADPRPSMWRSALLMFVDHPLMGVGLGQFSWNHFMLNGQIAAPRVTGWIENAHNLPLHVLAEFGLVGFIILATFVVLWIAVLMRQPQTPAHWWIWAIMWMLAVYSMVEYPLWYAFFLGLAAVVLGLGESRSLEMKVGGRAQRIGQIILVALLGLGWLALIQLFRDTLVLRSLYREAATQPEPNRQLRARLASSPLWPNVELVLARGIILDVGVVQESLALNSRVMRRYPVSEVVYQQAMLLAMSGDQAAARKQLDLASASFPEERSKVLVILSHRVADGEHELAPLLEYVLGHP